MKTILHSILDIPSASNLLPSLEAGASPLLVTGLSPIHRANLAAALCCNTGRPLFLLCPDDAAAQALETDLNAFLGFEASVLSSREMVFYAADTVSRGDEQKRIAVLDAMHSGELQAVICTVAGLLQRTGSRERSLDAAFSIKQGQTADLEDFELRLLNLGYIRTEQVEAAGQFSRRGGILDVFSPANENPVRIDFWGDEVDAMGYFDTQSQRRVENVTSLRVLPACELLPAFCDGGVEALAAKISDFAKKTAARSKKHEALRLAQAMTEDAERLLHTGSLPCLDRYFDLIDSVVSCALDFLPPDALVFISDPAKCAERARGFEKLLAEDVKSLVENGAIAGALAHFSKPWEACLQEFAEFPVVMADSFTVSRYPLEPRGLTNIKCIQLPGYGGSVETAVGDVKHYLGRGFRIVLLAADERRAKLLCTQLEQSGVTAALDTELLKLPEASTCVVSVGALSAGLEYTDVQLAVLTDAQIAGGGLRVQKRRKHKNRRALESYAELAVGDLVVHEHHGIGRFAGIMKMPVDGVEKDYIKISYAGKDSLYVPATQLDLVSKYIGGGGEDKPVRLSKMGGTEWTRMKTKAKAAAKLLAKELIVLYAERLRLDGHAFAPDTLWQTEFEDAFGYMETDDQLRCIVEIKEDMEKPSPMDRLLCGDVGYGKTEVALRGVMKCVLDGRQAAILVPTTVLAQQHFQTAMQRFFGYPVKIELLSRFRTPAQIKSTIANIKDGSCDIVIGTHRLIQKDIVFKNLGLLVVDEEQRFGVTHKERMKEMSRQIDVLTLSATPIPRTLNMAMSGIRDMSTIEEPPQDRMPVTTYVMEHDWDVVCDAIRREIQRGGQVYYLHNRIENIERTATRLSGMLDGVSVAVAHGRMDEEELSGVMDSMAAGETQLLVCTTIIETGIDIPNVNTLIIEDADRLGLAQLHQIRGRVGRSARRASAYLTFRKDKVLTEIAEKRLSAIREFAEFNSGFKIAMRDLEIRGAGNLLGAEQSGHMIDVGYDMYLKLLREAVLEERGERVEVRADCAADIAVAASIPESYIRSSELRMDLYRRIAMIRTEEEADDLTDELIDRFGEPPPQVNSLLHVALLRGEASRAGICDISQKAGALRFVVSEFDLEKISTLYAMPEFKGRIKVEAGQKPCVSLKLRSQRRTVDEARAFVAAYSQH